LRCWRSIGVVLHGFDLPRRMNVWLVSKFLVARCDFYIGSSLQEVIAKVVGARRGTNPSLSSL
jgi:hypothetical protein